MSGRVVLLVTHDGEGGIASDTRRRGWYCQSHTSGRVVLLVTHGGEGSIVGDKRRG